MFRGSTAVNKNPLLRFHSNSKLLHGSTLFSNRCTQR